MKIDGSDLNARQVDLKIKTNQKGFQAGADLMEGKPGGNSEGRNLHQKIKGGGRGWNPPF